MKLFVSRNKGHAIFRQHVVLIFDECHRSQFGAMHLGITKAFRNYHLFGFTGTPIMSLNAASGGNLHLRIMQQAFGDQLHIYTIVNAIPLRQQQPSPAEGKNHNEAAGVLREVLWDGVGKVKDNW